MSTNTDRIEIIFGQLRHFTERTKNELIQELTADHQGAYRVIDWHLAKSGLWVIREIEINGAPLRIITWTEMEVYPGWISYKTLLETGGLYYTDCPVHFLDMAPVPDCLYAREWRVRVRCRKGGAR